MSAIALLVERQSSRVLGGAQLMNQAICLGSAVAAGLVALGGMARLLRIREFDEVFELARDRVRRLFVT